MVSETAVLFVVFFLHEAIPNAQGHNALFKCPWLQLPTHSLEKHRKKTRMKTKDLALLVKTHSLNDEGNLCSNIGCVLFCAQSITQDVSGSHNKLCLSEIPFSF